MEIFDKILTKKQILINEDMKKHTSFRIGGKANVMLLPYTSDEIVQCVKACHFHNLDYYMIGNGSNLLVSDDGFDGVIIKIAHTFNKIEIHDNIIHAKSGASLAMIANKAMKSSLCGAEFMCSIPGTIGGGICMNAGAYGGELKDIVKSVTVLKNNEIYTLSNKECEFSYRNSKILKEKFIVLDVTLELKYGKKEDILKKMNEIVEKRNASQPTNFYSAGSTFKRPKNNFAGKLIMEAGLSGKKVGGACVSGKHCGFIVNTGGATCKDVLSLIQIVQKEVKNRFNIELNEEIRIIGKI